LGADGKYRWFFTRAEPLKDSDGKVKYWVGVNIDIDDKKRADEVLDAARERIGRATQSAALALRTDFTDDHVSVEVENNVDCTTSAEQTLEATAANESRETVVALAISRSIIVAQGGTLEAIRREGGVICVRIELPRFSSPKSRNPTIG
jgi:hypothetical protein